MPIAASSPCAASPTPSSSATTARAKLSQINGEISQVRNRILYLNRHISKKQGEVPKPSSYSFPQLLRQIQYLGSGHDPRITPLPEEKELAAQLNYLSSLNQKAVPLLEADELRKTANKLTKKEARLASLEQEKPAHKKAIADLRSEIQRLREDCELYVLRIALSTGQEVANAKAPFASVLQAFNLGAPVTRAVVELADWLVNPDISAGGFGVEAGVIPPSFPEASVWGEFAPSAKPAQPPRAEPYQLQLFKGEQSDLQQRSHADHLISDIIENMPKRGYLPQDGDHGPVLALMVQTAGWPSNTALAVRDSEDEHLATYTKGGNFEGINHTIDIVRRSNGEYANRFDPSAGASNQEQLFNLLLAEQPKGSQLGRGGDFRGSETREGRIVHLREQIAALAEQQRPQLFNAIMHSDCSQADPDLPEAVKNPLMPFWINPTTSLLVRKLHNETPNLSHARLEALLQEAPLSNGETRTYLDTGSLPAAFVEVRTELEKTVRGEQALDAVYHTRSYNPDADALMRQAASQELAPLGRNLTILEPGQRMDLGTANKNDVILRHYGNGNYRAWSWTNDEYIAVKQGTDSLFRAIASVLQPHEHRRLGMQNDTDVPAMRAAFGKVFGPQPQPMTTTITATLPSTTTTPTSVDYGQGLDNFSPAKVLNNKDGANNHLMGIGRVYVSDGSSCTATLIDTRSSASNENSPAYVLTAGHCVSHTNGQVILREPVKGMVRFNYFADMQKNRMTYKVDEVTYSTLKAHDIAILKMTKPLASFIQDGITPFRLASQLPATGSNVINVAAPTASWPQSLQLAACTFEEGGPVIVQPWFWNNMAMNQCQGAAEGSSGSPMLTRNATEIVALLTTTTMGGGSSDGSEPAGYPIPEDESNYGNTVTSLKHCFVGGAFNANAVGCDLAPVFSITLPDTPRQHAKPALDEQGKPIYPAWDLRLSIDQPFYRYKTTADVRACQDPDGYSQALPSRAAYINATMGPQIGMNMLCIVGMPSGTAPVDGLTAKNALTLATELHEPGPAPNPQLRIRAQPYGYYVNWLFENPLIKDYRYKLGSPKNTDCKEPTGYGVNQEPYKLIATKTLPVKICTVAVDIAGQESAPREDFLK